MTNPSIQNDFSYYRRLLSRVKNNHKVIINIYFLFIYFYFYFILFYFIFKKKIFLNI